MQKIHSSKWLVILNNDYYFCLTLTSANGLLALKSGLDGKSLNSYVIFFLFGS